MKNHFRMRLKKFYLPRRCLIFQKEQTLYFLCCVQKYVMSSINELIFYFFLLHLHKNLQKNKKSFIVGKGMDFVVPWALFEAALTFESFFQTIDFSVEFVTQNQDEGVRFLVNLCWEKYHDKNLWF